MENLVNDKLNINSKNTVKGFMGFCLLCLIITGVFIILIPWLLIADYSQYGLLPPFNDSLQFFYQTNGFLAGFYLVWLIGVIVVKKSIKKFTGICFWGILIFSILFVSAFASNLYYLNQVNADAGFAFIATYAPALCLTASLIAFLSVWEKRKFESAGKVILICVIISVFATAYYCLRAVTGSVTSNVVQNINLWLVIFGALVIVLINLTLFALIKDKLIFDCAILKMTDKEAVREEFVQSAAENMAEDFKEKIEVIEEAAEAMERDNQRD